MKHTPLSLIQRLITQFFRRLATKNDVAQSTHRILEALKQFYPPTDGNSRRLIRLQVVAVQFVQPQHASNTHMDSQQLGIDAPAGDSIVRVQFQPVDDKNKAAPIDGPVEATVQGDPATAQVAVGGKDGLFVDIKVPEAEGSVATVEVDADPDLTPGKQAEVISTIITVRRLGTPVGKAVTLGAKPENVTFPAADQFGQFPD